MESLACSFLFLAGNPAPASVREVCRPRCERRAGLGMGPAPGTEEKTKVSEAPCPPWVAGDTAVGFIKDGLGTWIHSPAGVYFS